MGFVCSMGGEGGSLGEASSRNGSSACCRRVLIVGGGVIGASCGFYARRHGVAEVEILEAVRIGCAASGKAGGFLARAWNDEGGSPVGPLSRLSFELHRQLAEELGAERIGYRRTSAVATRLGSGKARQGAREKKGKVATYLNHVQAESCIGSEEDCAQVHPWKLTHALVEASEAKVTIAKVTEVIVSEGRVSQLRLEDNSFRDVREDESVVFALGPWSNLLRKSFDYLPRFHGQKAHSMTLATPSPLASTCAFTSWRGQEPEIYPRQDEVYLCGFGEPPREVTEPPQEVVASPGAEEKLRSLAEDVMVPGAVSTTTIASTTARGDSCYNSARACHLPLVPDGVPVIGPLQPNEVSNATIAAGHSCWGILNAPATGMLIAEWLVDGRASCLPDWAIESLSPQRFLRG